MFSVKKLKVLLADRGYSVKGFSEACGISQTAISQILNHGKRPTLPTIGKFAKALNVSAADLLTDE